MRMLLIGILTICGMTQSLLRGARLDMF